MASEWSCLCCGSCYGQEVRYRPVTRRSLFHPRAVELFVWTKCQWDRFISEHSVFPCQYHSTNAPYPFIHLPPTLYNVSLPVLQFSPVSIIPPMLHTHSFTYHPRCVMFLSQYFSFPCQYHSTNAPRSSLSSCCSYQKDTVTNLGNPPISSALSEIVEHRIEKHFHLVFIRSTCNLWAWHCVVPEG